MLSAHVKGKSSMTTISRDDPMMATAATGVAYESGNESDDWGLEDPSFTTQDTDKNKTSKA